MGWGKSLLACVHVCGCQRMNAHDDDDAASAVNARGVWLFVWSLARIVYMNTSNIKRRRLTQSAPDRPLLALEGREISIQFSSPSACFTHSMCPSLCRMTSGYFMCSHVSLHLSPAVTLQKPNARWVLTLCIVTWKPLDRSMHLESECVAFCVHWLRISTDVHIHLLDESLSATPCTLRIETHWYKTIVKYLV